MLAFHEGRVCLVTARSGRGWGVPKGRLEPDMSVREVALLEAWEEAGLVGFLHEDPVGVYAYEKGGRRYQVTVFFMEVTEVKETWQEMDSRRRSWMALHAAAKMVYQPGLQILLRDFAQRQSASFLLEL